MGLGHLHAVGSINLGAQHEIGYESFNDRRGARTIVLLNGSLFNYRQWDVIISRGFRPLGKDKYRIVRYDYGGTGHSIRPQMRWDLFALVEELRELLRKLGQERVSLYGLSKGTIVGQLFAATYPQCVEAVGGYGWFHLGYTKMPVIKEFFAERLTYFAELASLEPSPLTRPQFDALWDKVLTHVVPSQRRALPEWLSQIVHSFMKRKLFAMLEPTPVRTMYDWFSYAVSMMNEADKYFQQILPNLRTLPVCIQHARRDGTLPYSMAEELHAQLPGSVLKTYGRGYDHVSVTLNPLQARAIVRDYLCFLSAS